jgi:hypothetical protein
VATLNSPTITNPTITGTLGFTGSSSSPSNFHTTQTSGAMTIGGTSGTGGITVGRSTVSQQTDIQAGATASGFTKTINFGSGGLAGSTTAITIGSTAGTSTTTLNGTTTLANALAVTSGGTGQTTATAAFNALAPSQATNAGKYLTTNGTTTSWGTISATGTVTSVAASVPLGLTISGSPVTTSGTLAITYTAGYAIPTTASQTNWDTAYTDRLKWDGGATDLVASTGRTSLGVTATGADTTYNYRANNLSDVANIAAAQTNLQVDPAGTAVALAIALG